MARESTGSRRSGSPARRSTGNGLQERDVNRQEMAATKIKREDHSPEDGIKNSTQAMRYVKQLSMEAGPSTFPSLQAIVDQNLLRRNSARRRNGPAKSDVDVSVLRSPGKGRNVGFAANGSNSSADALEPAWDFFKSHPDALADEEKATADYFRRLKMIQVEQETRNIFIHDTNDDTQTIYTQADVHRLENEAREVKTQLKSRKQQARSLRSEIDSLAQEARVFDDVRTSTTEAQVLCAEIQDMELELARLQAVRIMPSTKDQSEQPTRAPVLGTFTRDEAEEILNNQINAMESLESNQRTHARDIEAVKKDIVVMTQTVDRLQAERSSAEKTAREARAASRDNAQQIRDHKLEAVCRGYKATAALLQTLLGIVTVEAPNSRSVRATYAVQSTQARQAFPEVALLIKFESAGDRISGYELETVEGAILTDRLAPHSSTFKYTLDQAVSANDASLLVQEALLCIEAAES